MTSPNTSPRYQALLQVLRTADTLWNASRVFFARWDISPSQFNVLNLLSGRPEGLSQTELGRFLLTHRSNVTGLVDRLEKRGLLGRHENSGDRRAYRVVLTAAGKKLLEAIVPEFHSLAEGVWKGTSARRLRELQADLAGLARSAERLTEEDA
ncbi:MAG TPA: MarR family transcriptional regulator [Verrucomicrobiae bacterium]|nr:MarR family transcriptional regulator [Verrucomicrobiae bacterium]